MPLRTTPISQRAAVGAKADTSGGAHAPPRVDRPDAAADDVAARRHPDPRDTSGDPSPSPAAPRRLDWLGHAFCVTFGACVTLVMHGYQFGRGNHSIYLLDGLRRASPDLYPTDWFLNQTLQYHSVFGWVTGLLFRAQKIEPAFLLGYLALAVGLSAAWYGIVRALGGSRLTFCVSVILYYVSAAGIGLGTYTFLQDSSFLPSNVASVAMLAGVLLWMTGRLGWAGLALGVSGFFHLNYALVALGLWLAMSAWDRLSPRTAGDNDGRGRVLAGKAYWLGAACVFALSGLNVALALGATASRSGVLPLNEFVDLYVRLRHPHHYDPSSWPLALWVSFFWVMPFALAFSSRRLTASPAHGRAWREAGRFVVLFCGLVAVALVFAGLTYVSETLVQMSLFRFSVFPKLLACVAAAYLMVEGGWVNGRAMRWSLLALPIVLGLVLALLLLRSDAAAGFILQHRGSLLVFLAMLAAPAAYAFRGAGPAASPRAAAGVHALATAWLLALLYGTWDANTGLTAPGRVDPDYLAICREVRRTTPVDAVFLVPPHEEVFRLHARRGIVVNFKGVPQLSGELPEWRRRLERVLDLPDIRELPRGMYQTVSAMRARYERLPPEHLFKAARDLGAGYVLVDRRLAPEYDAMILLRDRNRDYCVYDLSREPGQAAASTAAATAVAQNP